MGIAGFIQSCLTSEAPIMISTAAPMQMPASHPTSRTGRRGFGAGPTVCRDWSRRTESVKVPPVAGSRGAPASPAGAAMGHGQTRGITLPPQRGDPPRALPFIYPVRMRRKTRGACALPS
jgi:hypothetical protein